MDPFSFIELMDTIRTLYETTFGRIFCSLHGNFQNSLGCWNCMVGNCLLHWKRWYVHTSNWSILTSFSILLIVTLNKFLSFRGWVPLSRLTFCAYLLNPLVANAMYMGAEAPMYASKAGFVSLDFIPIDLIF